MAEVGFIGLGHMGNPIAANLQKAGHHLVLHDLSQGAAANLLEQGADWADSPQAVAERSEVIFTSLPGPPEAEAVAMGPEGIFSGAKPGTVFFDTTSNLPSMVRRMAAAGQEKGVTVLDAAVSGGVRGAEQGTLSVMVGGDRDAFEKYKPLLDAIGGNVFYLGDVGAGCTVKLINNLLGIASNQLVYEGVVLGVKAGIDPVTLYEVINVSSGTRMIQGMRAILDRDWDDPGFTLELAGKDISLAVQLGRELGVPMPVASAAEQNFIRAKGRGLGKKGGGATLILVEEVAGVEVRTSLSTDSLPGPGRPGGG